MMIRHGGGLRVRRSSTSDFTGRVYRKEKRTMFHSGESWIWNDNEDDVEDVGEKL